MLKVLFRSHRLTKPRIINTYTGEIKQWKSDLKASIRQHGKDFWEIQTEVENEWIESYNHALRVQFHKKSARNRDGVIKIAQNTIALQHLREENAKKAESTLKRRADEFAETTLRKKLLIDTLNLESAKWITLENYQQAITENVLIPHSLDNSSYFVRLREISEIAGLGKIVSHRNLYNNRKESQLKNHILSIYFTELRSLIKTVSYSPLQSLLEDFEGIKAKLFAFAILIKFSFSVQVLLEARNTWPDIQFSILLFGDFNSTPPFGVLELMRTGLVRTCHLFAEL